MLSKLLKYEFKATARIFIPFYLFLILFSVINRIFLSINSSYFDIPRVIAMSVFGFTVVGIFVMTLIVTIQRFYKSLLSDEGYLSFTIPVKTHSHIQAKGLITLMWYLLNVIMCIIAVFILVDGEALMAIGAGFSEIFDFVAQFGASSVIIGFQIIFLFLIAIVSSILKIYAAVSMTNLTNKHKILVGLGAYIGFDIAEQTILSILLIPAGIIGKAFDIFEKFQVHGITPGSIMLVLLVFSVLFLLIGAVYFFLTHWVLKNKLNLE